MRSEISIDTSIVLAYLLVEDLWPADALWERALTASRLVECETGSDSMPATSRNLTGQPPGRYELDRRCREVEWW